jgi:hypothetical protein
MGPIYGVSSQTRDVPGEVTWLRPTTPDVIPAGSVFVVKIPSGYGYNFWNVCHVEEDLVWVQKKTLGYRARDDNGLGFYVGKYRCHLSDLQGCDPESIVRMVAGHYPTWDDIPTVVHMYAGEMSAASLERA